MIFPFQPVFHVIRQGSIRYTCCVWKNCSEKLNRTNGKFYYVAGLSMPLSTMWLQFCRSTSSRPLNFSHIRLRTYHPSISRPKSPVPGTFSGIALLLYKNFYDRHILRCGVDFAVGKYLLRFENM